MKLKSILIFFLILCSLTLQAQDYKVVGMESLPADMTAREHIKTDGNGKQCAVLRIATQNITAEQREGFHFESDWGSYVVEKSVVDGEIWVWVSPGLKTLKIKHSKLGQWELHTTTYGITVEALHTYKVVVQGIMMNLGNEPKEVTQQYLAFRISPANATLFVNDELWEVGSDGSAVQFVKFGTYSYRVMAPNYHPETGTVTVNDPENTQTVPVNLKPDFVEVTLKVDADAEIWVNNENKGTRTWTGNLGKGTYKFECKQAGHETSMITKEITADLNGQTINLSKPTPIYGSLNIESTPNTATLYIDGKDIGTTPKAINEILIGQHEIRLVLEGYTAYKETITVKKGERTQIKASLDKKLPISQPTNTRQIETKQPAKPFLMLGVAYSVAPQFSFGVMAGQGLINEIGWYVSALSNFLEKKADYECDGNGEIDGDYGNGYIDYTYSDQTFTTRYSGALGLIVRIADPVSAYFGVGAGFRNLYWELEDGTWVKNREYSYQGFGLDGGLLFHYKHLGFSMGVQTIGLKYWEIKAGIGFTL